MVTLISSYRLPTGSSEVFLDSLREKQIKMELQENIAKWFYFLVSLPFVAGIFSFGVFAIRNMK